jgi:hypothetical protein
MIEDYKLALNDLNKMDDLLLEQFVLLKFLKSPAPVCSVFSYPVVGCGTNNTADGAEEGMGGAD